MTRPWTVTLALLGTASPSFGAEIVRLAAPTWHLVPAGKEVDAIYGDFVVRNDKVVAVVADVVPGRNAHMTCRAVQGAVIDFTLREAQNDQLTAFMPHGSTAPAPGATEAQVVAERGREVKLRVRRPATAAEPVEATTEYTLRDGESFLRVETKYRNTAAAPARARLSDYVRCDQTFAQTPRGAFDLITFYDRHFRAAYGVLRAGGTPIATAGTGGTTRDGTSLDFPDLVTEARGAVSALGPGREVAISRYLVAGRHTAEVQETAARILGARRERLTVTVADARGKAAAGADVVVREGEREVSAAFTDAGGRARFALPAGRYTVTVSQVGRASEEAAVEVARDAAVKIKVAPLAQASFLVTDVAGKPTPCKVQLIGTNGTPDPNLGPVQRAEGCKNLYFSANGRFTTPIPPGSYRVVISRGPEYDAVFQEITVRPGETARVSARLERVVQSPGWVAADFHSHSTESGDNTTATDARIIALAAEGLEFAPSTEHNRIQSYRPRLRALGLERVLATSDGIELTGSPGDFAHHNAFPMRLVPRTQNNGGPLAVRDPLAQLRTLIEHDGSSEKLVQQNHPDFGWLFFDKDGDGVRDAGFGTVPVTHAIEIWVRDALGMKPTMNDSRGRPVNNRFFNWLQLLNQGARIPGVVNSDAHTCFHESGSARSYVRSSHDDPALIDEMDVIRAAKQGQVVMTNGPFMDVSFAPGGARPGAEVAARDGKGALRVRVAAANWLDVDRVQVLVNGRADPALSFTRAAHPEAFSNTVVKFDREIPVALERDAHLIVVAVGEKASTAPVMGANGRPPTAVSNPIFVDVDGGGFRASGDTLGAPLPHGKRAADAARATARERAQAAGQAPPPE